MFRTNQTKFVFTFFAGISVGLLFIFIQPKVTSLPDVPCQKYSSKPVWIPSNQVSSYDLDNRNGPQPGQRKILLDCGANVASTVEMFRKTYPGGRDFIIHSFELDRGLKPYFSSFRNHVLHCPVGLTDKDGTMEALIESIWSPERKPKIHRYFQALRDEIWGGGALFAYEDELKNPKQEGNRNLGLRHTVPTIDLSRWIRENINKDDYVIFKLDIQGAEYRVVKKMLAEGTFAWIDKFYGEFHDFMHGIDGLSLEEMQKLSLRKDFDGVKEIVYWEAENQHYNDFDLLHPIKVSQSEPGVPGGVYSTCGTGTNNVAITISLGMNIKQAKKVVSILESYDTKVPIMLFVYGDFADIYANDVSRWAYQFDIGMRESTNYPPGHFAKLQPNWVRTTLTDTELRFQEIGIQPVYYLPVSITDVIINETKKRGFRIITPAADYPPKEGVTFEHDNYYKFSGPERCPRALHIIHNRLFSSKGGVLTLDATFPDTGQQLTFILDYLVKNSNFKIISVADCVATAEP